MPDFKKRLVSDIVSHAKKNVFSMLPSPPPRKHIDIPNTETIKTLPKNTQEFRFLKFKFSKIKTIFLIFFIFLVYGIISIVFAEMKVEIVPKTVSLFLDETLELSRKQSPGKLVFSEISLSDKRNGSFLSSQKRTQESKATGIITVINKNPSSQVLVAGTRFESVSGKIYKIEKSIVVPANSSLDTKIVSQAPGDDFNEENLIDFNIPAFKEQHSLKFNTVYAKSKTKIEGGFSGTTFIIGQEDVKNAKNNLLKEALSETSQNLMRKTPDDSFLLAQSVRYRVIEENLEPKVGQVGEKFVLNITGSAEGVIVSRESLEKALGKKIPDYDGSSYHLKISNIENLSFELIDFEHGNPDFKIKVKGNAEFAGVLDNESALEDIFEKKLKKSSTILNIFPAASSVKVRFRPFWLRSFPENKERIKITVN